MMFALLQATPPGIGERLFEYLLSAVLGMVGGAFVAVVALRTRLALMDARMNGFERELRRMTAESAARFNQLDRRQIAMLQLQASIARKLQVDARLDDFLVRFISEDTPHAHAPYTAGETRGSDE